ncbi:DUF1028 domain-containing protein [Arthrobacter sp. NPDC055585]
MTISIVARCADGSAVGAAVTSSSFSVAARCIRFNPAAGISCSQSITDPRLGDKLLASLAQGDDPAAALETLAESEPHFEYRQLTVMGFNGAHAGYSGPKVLGRHAVLEGGDHMVAGNMLANPEVLAAVSDAFRADTAAPMALRLVHALQAGQDAGGEVRELRSAGVMVLAGDDWPVVDVRVDWEDQPLARLSDLTSMWLSGSARYRARAYDPREAYREISGQLEAENG